MRPAMKKTTRRQPKHVNVDALAAVHRRFLSPFSSEFFCYSAENPIAWLPNPCP